MPPAAPIQVSDDFAPLRFFFAAVALVTILLLIARERDRLTAQVLGKDFWARRYLRQRTTSMQPRKRIVKVDFFQVQFPASTNTTFEAVLAKAGARKLADRAVPIGDDYIRLEETSAKDGVTKGDLARIRMNDLPSKASTSSASKPIELDSDEGVVEQAAFLYDSETRILLLQRSRFVFPSNVVRFISEMGAVNDMIELSVVLNDDTAADFNRLSDPQRLEVSVARMLDPRKVGAAARENGESLEGFLDMINDTKARNVQMVLSAGPGDHSLKSSIKRFARELLRIGGKETNQVRKLRLLGTDADDQELLVDLVRDRMVAEGAVESDDRRRLPYAIRAGVLHNAFEECKDALRKSYRPR
jgi:hypothetical protein